MSVQVLRPGLLMTVQDMGRHGHQHVGLCPGGAMDPLSLALANALVGNYIHAAALELTVPRRATPRPVVPTGSVAIANEQTVIYPYAIAGGWNIIGRTPLRVFDASREQPSLFAAGDRVRFRAISGAEFEGFPK